MRLRIFDPGWDVAKIKCGLGTVRFIVPDGSLDGKWIPGGSIEYCEGEGRIADMALVSPGDLMVVPPRAIHTFENASGTEEAELYMTSTPGHYIDCKYLA